MTRNHFIIRRGATFLEAHTSSCTLVMPLFDRLSGRRHQIRRTRERSERRHLKQRIRRNCVQFARGKTNAGHLSRSAHIPGPFPRMPMRRVGQPPLVGIATGTSAAGIGGLRQSVTFSPCRDTSEGAPGSPRVSSGSPRSSPLPLTGPELSRRTRPALFETSSAARLRFESRRHATRVQASSIRGRIGCLASEIPAHRFFGRFSASRITHFAAAITARAEPHEPIRRYPGPHPQSCCNRPT